MRASTDLHGVLRATFSVQSAHVSATPPLELRGPFREGAEAPLYLLKNVTAGVFTGDRYDVTLYAEAGARVRVAAGSATKVFEMPAGRAESSLTVEAENDSLTVYGPATTILQSGSDFSQVTRIRTAPSATVVYSEIVALGRLASREHLAFRRFHNDLSVVVGEELVYRERYTLCPIANEGVLEVALAGHGVVGTLLCVGPARGSAEDVRQLLLETSVTSCGVTDLSGGVGWIVKVLQPNLQAATGILQRVANSMSRALR